VHCWAEDVAAKVVGNNCTVHYLEETTWRRQHTRSFDLYAWCHDPCDIPQEVVLTVTEPDRGHPTATIRSTSSVVRSMCCVLTLINAIAK
jgi:hypothetical protein